MNWSDFIVVTDHDYQEGLDVTYGSYDISTAMNDGSVGVAKTVKKMVEEMQTIPTITYRYLTIEKGIELEQRGIRMTAKAPDCSAIVKREYGVKKGISKKKTGEVFACLLSLASMAMRDETNFEIWFFNRVEDVEGLE